MSTKVFGCRVDHEVDPPSKRRDIDRRRKCSVNHCQYAMLPPNVGEAFQVQNTQKRVRRGLRKEHARVRENCSFEGRVVAAWHDRARYVEWLKMLLAELARTTVAVVGHHDVAAAW